MKKLLLLSCLTFFCGCAALGNKGLETGNIGLTNTIPVTMGDVEMAMPTYVPIIITIVIVIGLATMGLLRKNGQAVKYLGQSLLLLVDRTHK